MWMPQTSLSCWGSYPEHIRKTEEKEKRLAQQQHKLPSFCTQMKQHYQTRSWPRGKWKVWRSPVFPPTTATSFLQKETVIYTFLLPHIPPQPSLLPCTVPHQPGEDQGYYPMDFLDQVVSNNWKGSQPGAKIQTNLQPTGTSACTQARTLSTPVPRGSSEGCSLMPRQLWTYSNATTRELVVYETVIKSKLILASCLHCQQVTLNHSSSVPYLTFFPHPHTLVNG